MSKELNQFKMVGLLQINKYLAASKFYCNKHNSYSMVKLLKKSILSLIFILPFLFSSTDASASHMMGADITYKCIDSLKFRVELTYYRDCRGVPFSISTIRVRCSSGGPSYNVGITFDKIVEITPVCATAPSRCSPSNQPVPGNDAAIEQHRYFTVLDFNTGSLKNLAGCTGKIIIETGQCCRNRAITTGPANQNFLTTAEINIADAPCNSSPALTSEPIAILCCNQPFFFNNGALDTANFDSISYSWGKGLQNAASFITYSGTYSFDKPFSFYDPRTPPGQPPIPNALPPIGLFLDPQTGDLIFTPTNCSETTIAVIEMTEWRKQDNGTYIEVGKTQRDLQFISQNCPNNNPPKVNGPYLYEVCEGSTKCFNITTTDNPFSSPPPAPLPDPDTVELTWNRGISGATWTILNPAARLPTAKFCWTPEIGKASSLPYTFTATARDDACPLNAVSVRAFQIRVKPRALAKRDIDTLPCGIYPIQSIPEDGFRGIPSYSWKLLDENNRLVTDKKKGYFQSTGNHSSFFKNDTLIFRQGGLYIIQHTVNNSPLNCPNRTFDSLFVPPILEVDLTLGPDTFICAGTSLTFDPYLKNYAPPVTYQWSTMGVTNNGEFINNAIAEIGDTLNSFTLTVPDVQYDTAVSVIIKDNSGCTAEDSVQVFLKVNPKAVLPPDDRICTYDSITLVPNLDTAYWVDPIAGDSLLQGDTLYKKWFYAGDALHFDVADSITIHEPGQYTIEVRDSLGCADTDTFFLFVNDTVKADAGIDQELCFDDEYHIIAGEIDTAGNNATGLYRWYEIDPLNPTTGYIGTSEQYTFTASTNKQYRLVLDRTQEGVKCSDQDSNIITVNALPIIELDNDQNVCCNYGPIALNQSIIQPTGQPSTGGWFSILDPDLLTGSTFDTDSGCTKIPTGDPNRRYYVTYGYRNPSTTCYNEDSILITVNNLPRINLRKREYCQDIGSINLDDQVVIAPVNLALGTPSWRCIDSNDAANLFAANMLENRGPTFAPDWWLNLDESNYTIQNLLDDTLKLEFSYRNEYGCFSKDSVDIIISRVPKVIFSQLYDLCHDEGEIKLDSLTGVNLTDGVWCVIDTFGLSTNTNAELGGVIGDTINTLNSISTGGSYYLRYKHTATGCPAHNDTIITINPLPTPTISNPSINLCETANDEILAANPTGGTWSSEDPGALIASNIFSPDAVNSSFFGEVIQIYYDYQDPVTGCSAVDSISAKVDPAPIVVLPADTMFCRTNGSMSQALNFSVSVQNTDSLTWFTNDFFGTASQTTMGTVTDGIGDVILAYNNSKTDTFRLFLQAQGLATCNPTFDFFDITVHPIPDATLTNSDSSGCNPVTSDFAIIMNNSVDPTTSSYTWDLGDGTTASTSSTSATYINNGSQNISVTLASNQGCDTILSTSVDVYPIPEAYFEPDPNNYTTAALPRFNFNDKSKTNGILGSTIDQWDWVFDDPTKEPLDISDEQNTFWYYSTDTGTYCPMLTVTTNHGCIDDYSSCVVVGPDLIVFVPNAFTPDNAGPNENEGFSATISGEKTAEMTIFNRWGEIMFQTSDVIKTADGSSKTAKWNGEYKGLPVQQDVYAYALKVVALNDEVYTYTGTITIIK